MIPRISIEWSPTAMPVRGEARITANGFIIYLKGRMVVVKVLLELDVRTSAPENLSIQPQCTSIKPLHE